MFCKEICFCSSRTTLPSDLLRDHLVLCGKTKQIQIERSWISEQDLYLAEKSKLSIEFAHFIFIHLKNLSRITS